MEIKTGEPGGAHDNTVINRILLRFRPIAPKPVAGGSDAISAAASKADIVPIQRTKRKYVRVKTMRKSKFIKEEGKRDLMFDATVDALQSVAGLSRHEEKGSSTMWSFTPELPPISIYPSKSADKHVAASDRVAATLSRTVVESWLVIGGMSETCLEVGGFGSTDTEKIRNLEVDTCPGLISDGEQRVQWINQAYKKMVAGDHGDGKVPTEVVVRLVLKEKIPEVWQVFTCSVRVMYTWREEKHSQTMPCDVWRMDFGRFAWRLDTKAALKLGR